MNSFIKNTIKHFFLFVRDIFNFFFRFSERSVFCYHGISDEDFSTSITPQNFEKHINLLQKKGYHFVSVDEIVACIREGYPLPKKTIALTFDDGYRSVYENAFPILLKHKIPATVFLVENPHPQYLGNSSPILFESEISEMKQTGLITFGNHSKTHQMLDRLSGDELKREVGNGTYFAYPGGHYSFDAINAVEESGYKAAFSIRPGVVRPGDNPFLIKRNVITRDMQPFMIRFHASMAADWYYEIARGIKRMFRKNG